MILFDTTVLAYAVGVEHPLRAPCVRLLEALGADRIAATTTPEVIQEFAHVRSRRRPRSDAVARARSYQVALAPLTVTTADHLAAGLALFGRQDRLGSFDAVLAAVALDLDAELVSADTAFAAVEGLRYVVPDQAGVDRLLRA